MLTVAKVTQGAAGGYAEYLEGKSTHSSLGDYYLKDGERVEAPGRWAAGSQLFGINPEHAVTGQQLRVLMEVRRPDTGEELRRAGGTGEAVAALDATFSAPKSVSAAWAVAGPELRERIEQAHETALDRALTYATRHVRMVRQRLDPRTVVHQKASGLVATSWRHTTARAVADQLPDPQLHSHVLLHAAVRRDGRTVAIDSGSWLVHRREVGAAYRTEFARELNQLGFAVDRGTGRGGRYFELAGIPQELIDRWSSRHHQVHAAITQRLIQQQRKLEALVADGGPRGAEAGQRLELLLAHDQLSPSEERSIAPTTRTTKTLVTTDDLDTAWQRTATGLGLSRERVEVLRHRRPNPLAVPGERDVLEALTEFDATFPARDARAVALERSAGAPIDAALEQLVTLRSSQEILRLADGTGTTRAHRHREYTVQAITDRLTATHLPRTPPDITAAETDQLDAELAVTGGRLSDEQRTAIELACGSSRLVVIEGQAGTGKSTTLTGIARAHQQAGREIIITSTAALAAERLATDLTTNGVTCTAHSTASLDSAFTTGRIDLSPDTTIIHDEAALASTREQLQLLQHIEESGARLIAVWDPRQNQPVGAGGLWNHITEHANDARARAELTRNQRTQDPADRRDQQRFRDGEAELALRGYAARDRIHLHTDQQNAEDHALDAAQHDRRHDLRTVVIAQTSNEHLDELNARAQAIRHQHDELGDQTLPLPGRHYPLRTGDEIQIRHTITPEGGEPLRNGTTARVTLIDPDGTGLELELADHSRIELDREDAISADIRLAYVQHPFPAQGITTDTAHLIAAEHATREGTYVALTRARHATHIHAAPTAEADRADRLVTLADQLNRSEPDLPSIITPLHHEDTISHAPDSRSHDTAEHRDAPEPEHDLNRPTASERNIEQPNTPEPTGTKLEIDEADERQRDALERDVGYGM